MDSISNHINQQTNNPKKRVLFIITQSELGGAQMFLAQLAGHLDPNRFELAVAGGTDGNKEIAAILPAGIKYLTAKHLRRNPNVFSDITAVFEIKRLIKDFEPDTLFLNSSKAGFIGSLAAKLLQPTTYNLKTIYRIGGWTFNDPWPLWKRLAYRWLEKISASWKDYIIVNNKHDYDQAIKFGIKPREKIILVHNGIDPYKLEFLEKDEAKIRLYENLPSSQKHANFLHSGLLIGTIANFYPTKGLGYLINAFRILTYNLKPNTYNLVIIGDGPERQNLESRINNLKLENKIFLAGKIVDAYRYLKAFDIFVLPSVKEGFPWAVLEAMSAKLPVVVTAVGANPEVIENGSPSTTSPPGEVVLGKNGLIVPPANPQALAKAINNLVGDETLRRELGIQAHQTVLHKFILRRMLEQIEAIL